MKKLLLASATLLASTAAACATTADNDHHVRIIGNDEHQSIHIESNNGDAVIHLDGQEIEVRNGVVFIDGERHEMGSGNVIVIDGDDIRVGEDGNVRFSWSSDSDGDVDIRVIEAHRMREMALAEVARHHDIRREAHETSRAAMQDALAGLEMDFEEVDGQRWVIEDGERREMTDGEREQVREALRSARSEIREAMRNVRDEMRNVRIDVRRAEHDIERHTAHAAILRERLLGGGASSIRIEDEDGNRRVWIDDNELEGEELSEWFGRMEGSDLEGNELNFTSNSRIIIELDGADEDGVRVYEFGDSSDDEN